MAFLQRGNLATGHRRSQVARDHNPNRAGTLESDGSLRERGRPTPDAVKPADLAQAAGAFRAPDVGRDVVRASPGTNAYWPVVSLTHFVVKLVFAAPLSFFSCAAVSQGA